MCWSLRGYVMFEIKSLLLGMFWVHGNETCSGPYPEFTTSGNAFSIRYLGWTWIWQLIFQWLRVEWLHYDYNFSIIPNNDLKIFYISNKMPYVTLENNGRCHIAVVGGWPISDDQGSEKTNTIQSLFCNQVKCDWSGHFDLDFVLFSQFLVGK